MVDDLTVAVKQRCIVVDTNRFVMTQQQLSEAISGHFSIGMGLVPMDPSATHLVQVTVDFCREGSSTDPITSLEQEDIEPYRP